MNKVILIGRLTRDPELRYTSSNVPTATFSIAVDRTFTNQNGEREADFINIVVWRKQAENCKNYLSKGSQVAVEGRIQTRNYDAQDGTKRYVTEVICDNVTFLGSRNSNQSNNVDGYQTDMGASSNIETTDLAEDPYANMGDEVALTDDDLPFDFN